MFYWFYLWRFWSESRNTLKLHQTRICQENKWNIVLNLWVSHNEPPDSSALLFVANMEDQSQLEARFLQVKHPLWPRCNEKQATRTIPVFHLWYFLVSPQAPCEHASPRQDRRLQCSDWAMQLQMLIKSLVILVLYKTETSILLKTNLSVKRRMPVDWTESNTCQLFALESAKLWYFLVFWLGISVEPLLIWYKTCKVAAVLQFFF